MGAGHSWQPVGAGCGLVWGVGGVLLFAVLPVPGQMFLTVVIGGMCAGGVVISASHLSTALAFLLSASLPFAMLFFCQGTTTGGALGAMILVFAAALSLGARRFNLFFAETIRLRLELSRANRRLQDEIAERQSTEAALHQAQRLEAIGRLTGGIAHDFNNLLTIVIGNLTLAMGRIGGNSSTRPLLQSALQAAERGGALIQRLLAFARRQRLDPRSVELSQLLAGIEELLRGTLGGGVRLAVSSEPGLPPAWVDANQLELAILNLTINARDAMPEGGSLQIASREAPSWRRLSAGTITGRIRGRVDRRYRNRHGRGNARKSIRAVLYDQRARSRFRPRLADGPGICRSVGRGGADPQQAGEGTTVDLWLPRAEEPGLDKPAALGALLATALGAIR
jgi:signal transduction histidine kinase